MISFKVLVFCETISESLAPFYNCKNINDHKIPQKADSVNAYACVTLEPDIIICSKLLKMHIGTPEGHGSTLDHWINEVLVPYDAAAK